jgi:hypothetical protein
MSIMLIVSCYIGFFNVRRGWQSPRGCTGGRIGTIFLRPRGTSSLKGDNPAGTPGSRNGTDSFFGLKGHPSFVRDL